MTTSTCQVPVLLWLLPTKTAAVPGVVMCSQLETWSHAGASNSGSSSSNSSMRGKLEVQLLVPAGQQELAELLVEGEQARLAYTVMDWQACTAGV
jgi:hypothetical protein